MITSIVLKLQATKTDCIAGYLGRANYAETLKRLGRYDRDIDRWIHDDHQLKPLTCSALLGEAERPGVRMVVENGQTYWVRITTLNERTSNCALRSLWSDPPTTWKLDHHSFRVVDAICDSSKNAWTGSTTYTEIKHKYAQSPTNGTLSKFAFELSSPTSFKSNGMQMTLPLPELLFNSLLNRWNAVNPKDPMPKQLRIFAQSSLAPGQFKLNSIVVPQKNKGTRAGAVGSIAYTALKKDKYWLTLLQQLADFALFSGVGVQTSIGMGQVRRLPNHYIDKRDKSIPNGIYALQN